MKAIGLIRVSTKVQELESQSIKVKEAMLRDGFNEDDIILIEDKESGSKLSEEERSGLNKLKRIIETEPIAAVYCYELSRISRRPSVVYSIRDLLLKKNIDLVCVNPPFRLLKSDGTLSETASMTFSLFTGIAETENYLRVERIMRGKEKKTAEGKLSVGKPIFGYAVDKDHYVIWHPTEHKIVQEIFERYSNLESSGSIGKDLFQRNCLASRSNKIATIQTMVSVILKEKRYAKINPDSVYPAIISKELFNKCQDILASKEGRFKRKSMTKHVYPLQGYLYTSDGYILTPSISNNRYLKMNGSSGYRLSLNMKAVHILSMHIINTYLESGKLEIDREKKRADLNKLLSDNKQKIKGIDEKIASIEEENDRINSRIVKGRMSESKGDDLIDANMATLRSLEDEKETAIYSNSVIENKLIYLSNPFFQENEIVQASTDEELKVIVNKYLKKAVVEKLGFSKYKLTYFFIDGVQRVGSFYSNSRGMVFYNENDEIIEEVWCKTGRPKKESDK